MSPTNHFLYWFNHPADLCFNSSNDTTHVLCCSVKKSVSSSYRDLMSASHRPTPRYHLGPPLVPSSHQNHPLTCMLSLETPQPRSSQSSKLKSQDSRNVFSAFNANFEAHVHPYPPGKSYDSARTNQERTSRVLAQDVRLCSNDPLPLSSCD